MDQETIAKMVDEIAPWGSQEFEFEVKGKFKVKLPNRRVSRSARAAHASLVVSEYHEGARVGSDKLFVEGFLLEAESWLPLILRDAPEHWKAKDQPKDGATVWDTGERVTEDELGIVWCTVVTHWPHLTGYPGAVIEDSPDPLADTGSED